MKLELILATALATLALTGCPAPQQKTAKPAAAAKTAIDAAKTGAEAAKSEAEDAADDGDEATSQPAKSE